MRRRTTAAAGVLFAAGLSLGTTGAATAADLDCADFATQADAQAALTATPGDPNGLDWDDDGIACETLPGGGATATTEDNTVLGSAQVSTRPVGAVAAGDGSAATDDGSVLPYALGGLALAGAAGADGAAVAARRSSGA